jgi:hypothetical protein
VRTPEPATGFTVPRVSVRDHVQDVAVDATEATDRTTELIGA